jgi:hypothetical protein
LALAAASQGMSLAMRLAYACADIEGAGVGPARAMAHVRKTRRNATE